MVPFSIRNTRGQSLSAVSTFCSTSRIDTPVWLMRWISRLICDTSRGMMPSVGSSRMISLGRIIRQRAIASICCSPPESVLPDCFSRSLRRGKQPNTYSSRSRIALARQADGEIFQHRQIGKNAAALRDIADAPARNLMGRAAREIEAVELDRSAASRRKPHDRAQRRGLADAVAAEQRGALAGLHLEIDALQDVQLADMDVDVVGG